MLQDTIGEIRVRIIADMKRPQKMRARGVSKKTHRLRVRTENVNVTESLAVHGDGFWVQSPLVKTGGRSDVDCL